MIGTLRDYQAEGLERALAALEQHRSALVVWPTGTGKTVLFAAVAERYCATGRRVLVLAHREELIQQARDKIQRWTGLEVGLERAEDRVLRRRRAVLVPHLMAPVVVASIQTIIRRLADFDRDEFDLVVVDEAHHVSDMYERILGHFGGAHRLGVTATPDREDGVPLRVLYGVVAHEYTLAEAVEAGHLVPPRGERVTIEGLDLSRVRTTAGDLDKGQLDKVMSGERVVQATASAIVQHCGGRPTLTFAASVATANAIAEQLERRAALGETGPAVAIVGETQRETRARLLGEYRDGRYQHLVGCDVFLEGFDEPRISCVALARPTKSRGRYTQMIGRGTRLAPGKSDLLVLDLVGVTGRHQLVSLLSALDGRSEPAVRQLAEKLMAEGLPAFEALRVAAERIAARIREAAAREEKRKAAEEEKRERERVERGTIVLVAKTRAQAVPLLAQVARLGILALPSADPRPATAAQRGELERRGWAGREVEGVTAVEADQVLRALADRRRRGLCSPKQARVLVRYGYAPEAITFDEASRLIDAISAAGWRRPA